MYLSKGFFTFVINASVSSAAPLAAPHVDVLTERNNYPQAYGAHTLKMAEDDFKKAKREADTSVEPQA